MKRIEKQARHLAAAHREFIEFQSAAVAEGLSKRETAAKIERLRNRLEWRESNFAERWNKLDDAAQRELYRELGDDCFVCDGI